MIKKIIKIVFLVLTATNAIMADTAQAGANLSGSAELSYEKYDVTANGKDLFRADSFAQKYSLAWAASNITQRNQPQYYKISLGYDWLSFDTSIHDGNADKSMKDSFGKFKYNGEVSYMPYNLPIRFKAYAHDDEQLVLAESVYTGLITDTIKRDINGKRKSVATGFSFAYEAERASTYAFRSIPRMYIDYREVSNESLSSRESLDSRTRELAVAALNKENNWLQYKSLSYENFLSKKDNYTNQLVQIGLVDYSGRRRWSTLTNWITVSADGRLSISKDWENKISAEEYDVNFMAIASRKNWEARTFMNYNRELLQDKTTELARVPLYLRGVWSPDTDWFLRVSADRGRRTDKNKQEETTSSNHISMGFTTFKRSDFTLSPSLSLTTTKGYTGSLQTALSVAADTVSTRRFSDKHLINAGYRLNVRDDGTNNKDSVTWEQTANLKWNYRPSNKFSYSAREELIAGHGTSYQQSSLATSSTTASLVRNYIHSKTSAAVDWVKSEALQTAISADYDFVTSDSGSITDARIRHELNYTNSKTFFRLATSYSRHKNEADPAVSRFETVGAVQYRPDRYNDSLLKYRFAYKTDASSKSSEHEALQRYTYNFFTRAGVHRNIASLSEEFISINNSGQIENYPVQTTTLNSLSLAGRYYPTSRMSLYGSMSYQVASNSATMFYRAGLGADFKLMATSLEYSYAKTDTDNRVEKRLVANARRTF